MTPSGNAMAAVGREVVDLLVFTLGDARFAVLAERVREVARAVATARLPKAPSIVEGVINFRGRIVAVLDIRSRFALPAVPLHPDQHFVIAEAGPRLVALRVDRATDLIAVERDAITAAEPTVPGVQYVVGIARLADGLVVIHDLVRFLSLDEGGRLDRAIADRAEGT